MLNRVLFFAAAFIVSLLTLCGGAFAAAVEGRVFDRETGQALPYATIQVVGTGKATSANDDGRFRLVCEPGRQVLKVSHIGYYTALDTVDVSDALTPREIALLSTIVLGQTVIVYDRQFDPAQLIIVEAIKRKKEILERSGRLQIQFLYEDGGARPKQGGLLQGHGYHGDASAIILGAPGQVQGDH